ncbi:MmcQ/YjbR family DNA-binding protein [Actinomadura kijaniata]|uniref:MmcQ/YjbR family DNA-binding protein n=1 Tax=Actinomadura kijaniata TaxID=46161 RepID=UPI0008369D02|nr:MmcQ/YjbR family DNA-binding protein [Actinomadura kijaniata]
MKPETVAQHCLSLPDGTEDFPFGPQPAVYKTGGKIFALLAEDADPPRVSLKLPPDEVEALKAQYPGTVLPGYHLNKRHWVTVLLEGDLDDEEILTLIDASHETVIQTIPRTRRPPSAR